MIIPSVESQTVKPGSSSNTLIEKQKSELNVSILESAEVSVSAKDKPLALTLRAVIDELNSVLEPTLGANAIDAAVDAGLDVSPEATADRIVSLSTAFLPAYQESNPGKSVSDFLQVIKSGIDQGFAEARDILDGLGVLEGDIASNIDRTYELVQEKLDEFQSSFNDAEVTA